MAARGRRVHRGACWALSRADLVAAVPEYHQAEPACVSLSKCLGTLWSGERKGEERGPSKIQSFLLLPNVWYSSPDPHFSWRPPTCRLTYHLTACPDPSPQPFEALLSPKLQRLCSPPPSSSRAPSHLLFSHKSVGVARPFSVYPCLSSWLQLHCADPHASPVSQCAGALAHF